MPRNSNLENLHTEKTGLSILQEKVRGLYIVTKDEKRLLYGICGIEYKKYSRSIDCVILNVGSFDEVKSKDDFLLIEVKTTADEKVVELPYGMFFGFTENEEDLFKAHSNYRLCFVHTVMEKYCFLTFEEYEAMIRNKRIQYQINFHAKK